MDILMSFHTKDSIIQKIIHHIELFESFKEVYLFGSILNESSLPNDIDVLLVYTDFSSEISINLDKVVILFDQLYDISFDLTVLSECEEDESNFVNRLNSSYLRLK